MWSCVLEEPGEPGKTTDLVRATTSLSHVCTRIRTQVAALTSECFSTAVSRLQRQQNEVLKKMNAKEPHKNVD